MLTLTENASIIVKNIAEQTPGVAEGGLRISSPEGAGNNFAVAVAPAAEPNDQVVESSGARVFLEEGVAVALADKVLDAQVDGEGAVRFTVGDLA
jgi:iron-sulfur cluster assembly protein